MSQGTKYSIIIPVYNRPDEVAELLASLCEQTVRDFEVIVVEDGSTVPCREVCEQYTAASSHEVAVPAASPVGSLPLHYFAKENGGPGAARNYGAERAEGDYFIVLDSDVVLPPTYLAAIDEELRREPADAFGGPDRAHPDFTPVQKAISYAMTSFFTTGGIRGGSARAGAGGGRRLDKFYPRSFNMGVKRELWQRLGGFRQMRFGEDIDFSYRLCEAGARCRLFPEAWVWHKRRTDFRRFFRQVRNSGRARINLTLLHPGTMKAVHALPAVFTIGCALLLLFAILSLLPTPHSLLPTPHSSLPTPHSALRTPHFALPTLFLLPLLLYSLLIFVDSSIQNRSLRVGLLSVPAAFIQLTGYGSGFLGAAWQRLVLKKEGEGFDDNQKLYGPEVRNNGIPL